nr:transcription initiation factor IIA subunit 1-like [Leptinotarsa decemlineata]
MPEEAIFKTYQEVINDVISNTREHFVEDGVDDAILQELKQLWEAKLAATKAVDEKSKETDKLIGTNKTLKQESNNGSNLTKDPPPLVQPQSHQQHPLPEQLHPQQFQPPQLQHQPLHLQQLPHQQIQHQQLQHQQLQHQQLQHQQLQHQQIPLQHFMVQQQLNNKQVVGQVPPNNHMPQGPMGQMFPEWRRLPIQLTIPSATGEGNRILSIDVPEVFLHSHHLKSILTGEVIGTTMGLPLATACAFLQDHVNAAFLKHQQTFFSNLNNMNMNPSMLTDASRNDQFQNRSRNIPQRDGPADSFDEDEDTSEVASDNDNEDDEEGDEMEEDCASRAEDDPLNSGDDVSDADGTEESFDTENVIVCQFDKVDNKE